MKHTEEEGAVVNKTKWRKVLLFYLGCILVLGTVLLVLNSRNSDAAAEQPAAAETQGPPREDAPAGTSSVAAAEDDEGDEADLSGLVSFSDTEVIYLNGNITEEDIVTVEGTASYTIVPSLDDLDDGDQTVTITVTDAEGNTYSASQDYTFVSVEYAVAYNFEGMTAEDAVAEFMEVYGVSESKFSCFYYNTETGEEVVVGGDTIYRGASTVKLPFAMVYYDWLREGELKETDVLQLTYSNVEEGGGRTTSDYAIGAYVPITYLLEQSIVNSDNTAMNTLISYTGWTGYRNAIAEFAQTELSDEFYSSNVTTAQYSLEVLQYLYENQDDYETLIEHLLAAAPGEYLQLDFTAYDVAHKYGSYGGNLHDYGIVYAPQPYLIGVFTNNLSNAQELMGSFNQWMLGYTLYRLND